MFNTYDLAIELLSILLALGVGGVCVAKGYLRRYLFVNVYLFSIVVFTAGCFHVRSVYGYDSTEYFYFYYAGDAFANILGYLLIGSFFDRLLRGSVFQKYVRPTLVIAFLLIAGISARVLSGSLDQFYSRFIFEFQQNIYFLGVLLTLLLWISMSYLRVESRRFVLLVSGLGIYFSSHAANYAMQFLFPSLTLSLTRVPPLAYNLMLVLWLYTFLRVPEGEPAAEKKVSVWETRGDVASPTRA
jgi:hypothetical protein